MRSRERGICPIDESIMTDSVIFQCTCVKVPYFYFRSEIWWSEWSRWSTCVIVPNVVAIGQTIPEIWLFFDFSRRRPPQSRIFLNFRNFNDGKRSRGPAKLRHRAKFSGGLVLAGWAWLCFFVSCLLFVRDYSFLLLSNIFTALNGP